MKEKQELIRLCHKVGERVPEWVQGRGANLSLKNSKSLWIKASGWRLDRMTPEGIVEIDRKKFSEQLNLGSPEKVGEAQYAAALKQFETSGTPPTRPSMESGVHLALPGSWVIHIHSLAAILMARQTAKGLHSASSLTTETIGRVPFCNPGWELSLAMRTVSHCPIILLQNHGVILQGDTDPFAREGILSVWAELEKSWCRRNNHQFLAELLITQDPSARQRLIESLPSAPKKMFFPDVAVFETEMDRVLSVSARERSGEDVTFSLKTEIAPADRDLVELWRAIQILNREAPDLEEIRRGRVDMIRGLESEKHRRKVAS